MSSPDALPGGEVLVYQAPDGQVRVDVRLERETVWLTQQQMADLFGRERSVVTKHIRNAFQEGELDAGAVCAKFAHTAADGKTYQVDHYNLDVIISVGYRVKSLRGTQFRIWATNTLRDHLLRGYTLNQRRLRERGVSEIEQAVGLLARTLTTHALVTDEGRAVLDVVQHYARSWRLLLEYDEERLAEVPGRAVAPTAVLSLDDARAAAARLRDDLAGRGQAGSLVERNRALHRMLVVGVTVEYRRNHGSIAGAQARGIDFDVPEGNDWLAVNQFTVSEGQHTRRPDVVLFVNGLPLAVIELKNPADESATVWSAWQQLQTYQAQVPALFVSNAALVVSDGVQARIGSLGAGKEWFKPWRTITGREDARASMPQLQVVDGGLPPVPRRERGGRGGPARGAPGRGRPHSGRAGLLKVVMTGSASDLLEWQPHILRRAEAGARDLHRSRRHGRDRARQGGGRGGDAREGRGVPRALPRLRLEPVDE